MEKGAAGNNVLPKDGVESLIEKFVKFCPQKTLFLFFFFINLQKEKAFLLVREKLNFSFVKARPSAILARWWQYYRTAATRQ